MKLKLLILNLIILGSCNYEVTDENETTKKIEFLINDNRLDLGDVSEYNIDHIVLESAGGKKYCLVLDTLGRVSEIQDLIELPDEKEYVNTWIGFDKEGQIDFPRSYYYGTFLTADDTTVYMNCNLERVLFYDSKYSILVSNFNNDFKPLSKIDTLPFDDDFKGSIPVKNWKIGKNNIKFIVLEEGVLNGKPRYKKTYVDKDFFIQEPK